MASTRTEKPLLWKAVVGVALLLTVAALLRTAFDAATSPTPLNLFAFEVALFSLVGIIMYGLLGNVDVELHDKQVRGRAGKGFILALNSALVVVLVISALLLWESLYVPSPFYYVSISVSIALVGVEILSWPGMGKRGSGLVLLQVALIGVLIQLSFSWLNPKSIASDPYFDWLGIDAIARSGRIPESLGYFFYFPSFHVLNAVTVEVAGIGINSYSAFNHLLMTLAVPISYLLAREIVSQRKALLAALLLVASTFFFLSTAVLPVLLGASLMILSCYGLVRYRKRTNRKLWGTFWLLSSFVFFSHPVNALILAAILGVFWFASWTQRGSGPVGTFAAPTATYAVAYLSYLGFIAINAFTILLQSLVESGPRYYFARMAAGPVPADFIAQAMMSTAGLAILFLPATLAALSWLLKGNWSHRLVLGVVVVLVSIPASIVFLGKGPYGLQAARTILYLSIFVVVPAASGLLYLVQRVRRDAARLTAIGLALFVLAFFSTSSYLTGSGNRLLSESIPVQTSYVTDSMIAAGGFLERVSATAPLTLDPALAAFLAPHGSGLGYPVTPYPIEHSNLVTFPIAFGNASVVLALSNLYLANSGYEAPDVSYLEFSYAARTYDSGMVWVYAP